MQDENAKNTKAIKTENDENELLWRENAEFNSQRDDAEEYKERFDRSVIDFQNMMEKKNKKQKTESIKMFEICGKWYDPRTTELDLSNKQLDHIPEEINKFVNLIELSLNNNKITQIQNLDKLTNLQKLDLNNNQIKKIQNLDKLTNLQNLRLGYNQITKIQNLNKLTELNTLYLSYNQIKRIKYPEDLDLDVLNLEELYLDGNQLTQIPIKLLLDRGLTTFEYKRNYRI